MRRVLARRDMRLYLFGHTLSVFGDTALWLALGDLGEGADRQQRRRRHGHSSSSPRRSCSSPLSGMVVDRVRRRPLLIAANLATAVAVLPLLLVHDRGDVWILYAVTAAYGVSFSVLGAGGSALLATMLPADELADANGVMQTAREGLRLVAPLAGAALFTAAAARPWRCSTSRRSCRRRGAAARCGCASRARSRLPSGCASDSSPGPAPARTPPLRRLTVACAVALLVIGFSETLTFEVAGTGLGRDPALRRRGDRGPGHRRGGRCDDRRARSSAAPARSPRRAGMLVFSLGTTLLTSSTLAVVLVGIVLFGVGIPWIVVALFTLLQRTTPGALQGRTYSAIEVLVGTPQTLSIALGAAAVAFVDYRLLLLVEAAVVAAAGAWLLTQREQRRRSTPLISSARMDVSLFFAGTAGSVPTARRGLPALLLRAGGERILFDCGEGTQQQLLRSVGLPELDAVFITHFHLDHWLGLLGMVKTFDLRARERPLTIYGPPGLQPAASAGCGRSSAAPATRSTLAELEPHEEIRFGSFLSSPFPVKHRVEAYGYAFVEDDRPGRFDVEAARALGVPRRAGLRPPPARRDGRRRERPSR